MAGMRSIVTKSLAAAARPLVIAGMMIKEPHQIREEMELT
jgi:hypothetical protein